MENEPIGTSVMRVRAIDTDGTAPNNEVTYHLKSDEEDNFSIDAISGEIKTRLFYFFILLAPVACKVACK